MLSSLQSFVTYQGNGVTTVFPFNFLVAQAGHLVVSTTNNTVNPPATTVLTGSQYSVTGIGNANGGSITTAAVPVGWSITIQRVVPCQQLTALANQGAFYPQAVESALDYITMIAQQLAAALPGSSPVLPAWISGMATLTDANGAVNSATPSLAGLYPTYKTANTTPTTISDMAGKVAGHYFKIVFGDANTTIRFSGGGAALKGNNAVDWTPAIGDSMECVTDGAFVYCITSGTLATLTSYLNTLVPTFAAGAGDGLPAVLGALTRGASSHYARADHAHGITTMSNLLSADVTMTSANTYYDGPSITLPAGIWHLSGSVLISGIATNSTQCKLWDGSSSVLASASTGGFGQMAVAVSGVTPLLVAPTTYKISACLTATGAIMRAAMSSNPAGNNASFLYALKIGG